MLISDAYAQAADGAGAGFLGGGFESFVPLLLIVVVFYFLLIRPQQKRMKEHKAMLASIKRKDRIVTGGGVVGTVIKVENEAELLVEVAENVRVRVMRDMVATVLTHGDGAAAGGDKGKPAAEATAETKKADEAASGSASKLKGLLDKK
ncbi:preprotein translocase subunit YajC [Phaeovibrio sulfidiphilus]|uniref:Sec translocon accessory complex subunit YajC n=1 Tax=Phaeovibrio sulfidiphilus TaxID=1220600 RepID=A0A8J7CVY9_9PROT|nr:preprotein translocase subunit YajC [Phaeovibrio sulfidiphilus]MBE1236886.1 preprotein translocase subunit YajC [Phaeovibrio sulfidiphilus]